jgi:subtilisin family serine protease
MALRVGTAVATAVLVGVACAACLGRATAVGADGGRVVIGYANDRALASAVHASGAVVVRNLAPLRVAELRTDDIARLRRLRGIRFVQRPATRASAAEPALASIAGSAPLEWQYLATDEGAVPDAVLRAAANVRIAVIDTGADVTAPDIAAKSPITYNTRTGTTDVRDSNGHGTFVASIAAGSVTNGDGIAGAGGDAQLLVIKSGSASGAFTDVDEAAGITYAVDHGAKIINLSVGGPTTSTTEKRAIQYAVDHDALVVAAAGNEYAQGDPVEYPAALLQPVGSNGVGGGGLAVGASDASGAHAPFSNTGSWISLVAPGVDVLGDVSALSAPALYPRTQLPGSQQGLYGYASGTSFAAPQVAGAAALVWAANPALTAPQVAQILKQTATGGGRWSPELGFGVLDVGAAVARAQAGARGVLLSGDRVDRRVHLTWGGDGSMYTLSLATDGGGQRALLASTERTSVTLTLARGHTYSFTVAALDPSGAQTATSAPLIFSVAAAKTRR